MTMMEQTLKKKMRLIWSSRSTSFLHAAEKGGHCLHCTVLRGVADPS